MEKKYLVVAVFLLYFIFLYIVGDVCVSNAGLKPALVSSGTGTISVYSYGSPSRLSHAYSCFLRSYGRECSTGVFPPEGTVLKVESDCYDAAVCHCSGGCCVVVYEGYDGCIFVGTYERNSNDVGEELEMTDFMFFLKVS